ncbi:MAG: type II secretion system protein [Planctomycetota bacterium]|nr:type II secretion system protein [Planctomycetota bacterium]
MPHMMILRTGTDPARLHRPGPHRPRSPRAPAAFTLIELLVVMGIIGVLVAMLLPAVNRAVIVVRNAACASRIAQIEAGLANFKNDWGIYPPSANGDEDAEVLRGACPGSGYGRELLTVALIGPGPERKGWGRADDDNALPFGGRSETVTYGPYYQGEFRWTGRGAFIPDAFPSPDRPILYYRYSRRNAAYNDKDNPSGEFGEGFQNEAHFKLSAMYETPDSTTDRWQRQDYLLICAGADRMYGWIKDTDPPEAASRRSEIVQGTAMCDDLTNFD